MYQAMVDIVLEAGKLLLSARNIQDSVSSKGLACDLVTGPMIGLCRSSCVGSC